MCYAVHVQQSDQRVDLGCLTKEEEVRDMTTVLLSREKKVNEV